MRHQITEAEAAQLREMKVFRDECALKLGVARLEFLKHESLYVEHIRQSLQSEQRLGEQLLKARGIDPETGQFRIHKQEIQQLENGIWRVVDEG